MPPSRAIAPARRSRFGSVPRAFMARAPLAVAAVLFVAATVVYWRAARLSVAAVPCTDADAAPRAPIAPVVDREAPVEPSDRRTDPSPRARPLRTPTRAAPSETKPQRPTGPGSRVAVRSLRDDVRPRGASHPFAMEETSMIPGGSLMRGTMAAPPHALQHDAPVAIASALPVIPAAWPVVVPPGSSGEPAYAAAAHASDAWTRPASFSQEAVPAGAGWSLSPGSPRWYGVGLPPSTTSMGVPSGVGVMAQVDVAKALDAR